MSAKREDYPANERPPVQFCALEYRPQDWAITTARSAPVILLAVINQEDDLRLLAHPDLRTIVQGRDLDYIEALLPDFLERAQLHPSALFKHLSSLGVGPLVTREVGVSFADRPPLQELSSGFVQIS